MKPQAMLLLSSAVNMRRQLCPLQLLEPQSAPPQQPVQVLAAHTFAVRRVRFCPHSAAQLLSASYDMSVCLWDVVTATHRPLQQYNHHSEFVIGLEWSLFQER